MQPGIQYDSGFSRGHGIGSNYIKIGARDVMEVLAGRKTLRDFNEMHGWNETPDKPEQGKMRNPFEIFLSEGRLPTDIELERSGENSGDDWITLHFDGPDAAITPFR
jgi:hypothetical protein